MKNRGFTLAEIMIVLTVIGILTAIILPSAQNLMPDKNLMKFKKAYSTLGTAITELVMSDKYYKDGDLGIMPNGDLIDGTHDGDNQYFCQTLADVLNPKKVECKEKSSEEVSYGFEQISGGMFKEGSITKSAQDFDTACIRQGKSLGAEITLPDGVVFYQAAPNIPFGTSFTIINFTDYCGDNCDNRVFNPPTDEYDRTYKIFCIDVDGIPSDVERRDCKNECPFGFGIRADGKIMVGTKAAEWLKKSASDNN